MGHLTLIRCARLSESYLGGYPRRSQAGVPAVRAATLARQVRFLVGERMQPNVVCGP